MNIIVGTSRDTSDFIADTMELCWANRRAVYGQLRRLTSNGPEIVRFRT